MIILVLQLQPGQIFQSIPKHMHANSELDRAT
jgi:hypothetical protein